MNRKTLFLVLFFYIFPLTAQQQEDKIQNNPFTNYANFSDFVIASGEMIGVNLTVYSVNNLIISNITKTKPIETSFDVFVKNLQSPWIWDNSSFNRNQLYHPYFGSLYFISGRANNLNFLESLLLATTGSFLWESYFEGPLPSINDFITTPSAGSIFGETLHRLYFSFFDYSPVISFFISPIDGITYLLRQKNSNIPIGQIDTMSVSLLSGINFEKVNYSTNKSLLKPQFGLDLSVIYNNPYGHTSKEFFDQFSLNLFFSGMINHILYKIAIEGSLYSHEIYTKNDNPISLGISLNYDFLNESLFSLSDSEIGLFFRQKYFHKQDKYSTFEIQCNYVYLGTSDIFYILKNQKSSFVIDKKQPSFTYKYGPNIKTKYSFVGKRINLFWDFDIQYLLTYSNSNSQQELTTNLFLISTDFSIEYKFTKFFSLGLKDFLFYKNEYNNRVNNNQTFSNYLYFYSKFYIF